MLDLWGPPGREYHGGEKGLGAIQTRPLRAGTKQSSTTKMTESSLLTARSSIRRLWVRNNYWWAEPVPRPSSGETLRFCNWWHQARWASAKRIDAVVDKRWPSSVLKVGGSHCRMTCASTFSSPPKLRQSSTQGASMKRIVFVVVLAAVNFHAVRAGSAQWTGASAPQASADASTVRVTADTARCDTAHFHPPRAFASRSVLLCHCQRFRN